MGRAGPCGRERCVRAGCMTGPARTEGITERFRMHPDVTAELDDGYRGLANVFPGQV